MRHEIQIYMLLKITTKSEDVEGNKTFNLQSINTISYQTDIKHLNVT